MYPTSHGLSAAVSAALLMALSGCGESRTSTSAREPLAATYLDNVKPILDSRCASCHKGVKPAGSYDLSSYPGVLGPGSDLIRNVLPGEAKSRLLTKLDSVKEAKHWGHLLPDKKELADGETAEGRRKTDLELLRAWVVKARLAYFDVTVHPPTWVYPGDRKSEGFHGGLLRKKGWKLEACEGCHGDDLKGGTSGKSCTTCHQQGPTGCTTCHGSGDRAGAAASAPPSDLSWKLSSSIMGVGAHEKHLQARTWWAAMSCDDCHKTPRRWDEAGHLTDQGGGTDLRAEVVFGPRAKLDGVTPTYDKKTGTCDTFCHGASFSGQGQKTVWTSTKGGACGDCHTVPALFGGLDCANCHPQSVKRCTPGEEGCLTLSKTIGVAFLDASLHGDGKYPLGRKGEEGTCYGCHGTKDTAGAPGPDLAGKTDISEVTVGLHKAHVTAGPYRDAVPCSTCHTMPKKVTDKGHFDDDVPAEVLFDAAASGKLRGSGVDLKPTWDRKVATCGKVHCHGLDGGKVTTWSWTKKLSTGLACDSCHGLPPKQTITGKAHPASTDCKTCHSAAYTSKGALDPTKHINGEVN